MAFGKCAGQTQSLSLIEYHSLSGCIRALSLDTSARPVVLTGEGS